MLQEEEAVRVGDVVRRRAAERARRLVDRVFAAFDLDEHADRRLIDRDHHVVVREFLAVFLVAEPDVQAELFEDGLQRRAVGDDGFVLFADLDRGRESPGP